MIKAELRWALRGRVFVTLLFLAIALNALSVYGTITGLPGNASTSDRLMAATSVTLVGLGFGGNLFSMLFGAIVVTNDFRNSAIVRRSFLAGGAPILFNIRLVALCVPAAVFALASAGSVIVTASIALPLHGFAFVVSPKMLVVLCGVLFTVFAMTYFGHFIGWLVRNTVVTLIGLLVYSLLVETILIALIPQVGVYLPGGATQSITLDKSGTDLILPVGAGYAVLIGWVVALGIANAFRVRRTDLV